ncbi:hypothetical protein Dimus_008782 [Dionaea muscipula]
MMMNKTNMNKTASITQRKPAMEGTEWEMRPGGMLVQRRNLNPSTSRSSTSSTIKVRVKYGSLHHEIQINAHASFGELKKILVAPTGLHPEDQKLIFKDKERDSSSYLDVVGVKDGSNIVLVEDIIRQEKRFLELKSSPSATMEKALRSIAEVAMEVDKLSGQVTSLESVILRGGIVAEKELLNLIELLMSQLIKLDGIKVDGDLKLKRKTQVIRVQKYIEILDKLKVESAISSGKHLLQEQRNFTGEEPKLLQGQQRDQHLRNFNSQDVVMKTTWEKF